MSRLQSPCSLRAANIVRRVKLSNDPNNTTWSRSASKYGQRILQLHGWTPGELLGASGAVCSDLRSAASGSHIQVALKDDKMGLGAKHNAACVSNETTGLNVFQDLLGRLNGKSVSDIGRNRTQSSNVRSSAYIECRWGNLRFVSGGFLVGDDSRELGKNEPNALNDSQQTPTQSLGYGTLPEADRPQEVRSKISKRKKRKKRTVSEDDRSMKATSKEFDCRRRKPQSRKCVSVESQAESRTSLGDMGDGRQIDKAQRHDKKAERKLKRKANRDARHQPKVRDQSSVVPSPDLIQLSGMSVRGFAMARRPLRETRTSQESGAGGLSVRHRYIQQKRICMMDPKALNEVCVMSVISKTLDD